MLLTSYVCWVLWYHFLSGGLEINCIFIWKSTWYVKPLVWNEDFNPWNSRKSQVKCRNARSWMWCPHFGDVSAFLEDNKVRPVAYMTTGLALELLYFIFAFLRFYVEFDPTKPTCKVRITQTL